MKISPGEQFGDRVVVMGTSPHVLQNSILYEPPCAVSYIVSNPIKHHEKTFPDRLTWGDWPRSRLRRQLNHALHTQTVELTWHALPSEEDPSPPRNGVQTRAQRAHYRLFCQRTSPRVWPTFRA